MLALPYGDLDVAPRSPHRGRRRSSRSRSTRASRCSRTRGISSAPGGRSAVRATCPPRRSAVLDPDLPRRAGHRPALDEPCPSPGPDRPRRPAGAAAWSTTARRRGHLGSGPRVDPRSALAVRQRLLAEAAVHALSEEAARAAGHRAARRCGTPVAVGAGRVLRRPRAAPWLDGGPLSSVVDPAAIGSATVRGGGPGLPEEEAAERGPGVRRGRDRRADRPQASTLRGPAHRRRAAIGERLDRQALLTSSIWSRAFPGVATERARERRWRAWTAGWTR